MIAEEVGIAESRCNIVDDHQWLAGRVSFGGSSQHVCEIFDKQHDWKFAEKISHFHVRLLGVGEGLEDLAVRRSCQVFVVGPEVDRGSCDGDGGRDVVLCR